MDHEDAEFIKGHLNVVPFEVAKLLDNEERRSLVANLLDTSEKKSLCPVGKRQSKKAEGSTCNCEDTYLESLRIKTWSKYAQLSEGRNKYALNEIAQFLLINRRRNDAVDPDAIPPNVQAAMGENLIRRVMYQKRRAEHEKAREENEVPDPNVTTFKKESNGVKVEDTEEVESPIPADIVKFLSAKERANIESKLAFINEDVPPTDADEFFSNNRGMLPVKIAKLMRPEEREMLIRQASFDQFHAVVTSGFFLRCCTLV